MKNTFKFFLLCFTVLVGFSIIGCGVFFTEEKPKQEQEEEQDNRAPRSYEDSVKKVSFTGSTATVTFHNLDRHTIYLVRVNRSENVVTVQDTASTANLQPSPHLELSEYSNSLETMLDELFPETEHPGIRAWNANPPPFIQEPQPKMQSALASPSIGSKRNFWVELPFRSGNWYSRPATLMAAETHSNIWVMDGNKQKLTAAQAKAMADKFDIIYPAATNILGYEYGGGPSGNGGVDGDNFWP